MSIAELKLAVAYQAPTERDRCGNCRHIERTYVDRMPPYDTSGWRCRVNDFTTTVGAICTTYEADAQRKRSTPPRFN
jgi:hypothetical protein